MPKRAEYGVDWYAWRGSYRVYKGGRKKETLPITPDSAEWFELLGRINSFHFRGMNGDFLACKVARKGVYCYWNAMRQDALGVMRNTYIGKTDRVTVEALEGLAEKLEKDLGCVGSFV